MAGSPDNNSKIELNIVIISYNCRDLTAACIDSVPAAAGDVDHIITVVDNASADDSVEYIKSRYPDVNIIANVNNLGYAAAVNIGAGSADSEFVVASNADVVFHPGSIEKLVSFCKADPKTGVAGPQQVYPDGSWQYSYGRLPGIKLGLSNVSFLGGIRRFIIKKLWGKTGIEKKAKQAGYIDGAVHCFRKSSYDEAGGWDEDYFFYTEEADFCFRLKKNNWKIMFCPDSVVTHIRGGSSDNMGMSEDHISMLVISKVIFCQKHLSKKTSKAYIRLETMYADELIILWNIIRFFASGGLKKKAEKKAGIMKIFRKSWKEELAKL